MFAALDHLLQSLNELQVAIPDEDHHRVDAINFVQQAICEVNLGIQGQARHEDRPQLHA